MTCWGAHSRELVSRLPSFPRMLVGPSRRRWYGGKVHPQPGPCRVELCSHGHTARLSDPLRGPCGLWVKGKRRVSGLPSHRPQPCPPQGGAWGSGSLWLGLSPAVVPACCLPAGEGPGDTSLLDEKWTLKERVRGRARATQRGGC